MQKGPTDEADPFALWSGKRDSRTTRINLLR